MKNIDINIKLDDQMIIEKDELIKCLKTNKMVNAFIMENNLNNDIITMFPYRFKLWLTNLKKCEKCTGLHSCKQQTNGQYDNLVYDGFLRLEKKYCNYYLTKSSQNAHMKNYWINDLPPKYFLNDIKNVDLSNVKSTYKKAYGFILDYFDSEDSKGLFLFGNTGVGKTYLATCACNYYAKENKKVAFINLPTWISKMKLCMNDKIEFEKQIEMFKKAYFVVIDDIGAESVTPWVRDELLFPILNYRMDNNKKTFFTCNESFESLKDHYSFSAALGEEKLKAHRIMERIQTLAIEVELKGDNLRNM